MTTAINIIIDTPNQINMARSWETPRQSRNRVLWLDYLYKVLALARYIEPANDTINPRALRHITALEQLGKLYEYNSLSDYLGE